MISAALRPFLHNETPCYISSVTVVALDQLFGYYLHWTQYNIYYTLFDQGIWNMERHIMCLHLIYSSTLRHWSTTPPIQSYFIQWALLWSSHSPHLGNGSAAGATHIEPLAQPYAIGATITTKWQHPRKHWGLGKSIWTSWHHTSCTSSIFFQHGTHGYTHSTTRDIHYIYSLRPSINHCITPTLPTFSTPAAPTCHKTHSQPTVTPTFNKTPPHQPQSRHSSTTSHTQNSRPHSCTTSIKSTKSQESLTELRRLHQPSLSNSGAVQTIAALLGPTGNPQSSHQANSYPGTRTITTGKSYWHHPSSMVFSRRRNPYQPQKWFQSTPELGFRRRKNAPNALRMQGKMAIAPLATDRTLGDYAAAASYIYESWTAETSYTSLIDSWRREMHRDSYSHTIGNSCSLRVFSSIECQRGRKILAHYSPRALVSLSKTLLFLFFCVLYTLRCWKPAEFDWNIVQRKIPADLGTLYHYLCTISVGTLDTLYSSLLIYISRNMVGTPVSIPYILPYLPPRPSSTRTQKSIELAP